ncbi:MAG: helix-turn-helix domain-containing protein [Bacillota bacterium]|nr:helix-turn-helix domain-containing protein [Bacillota bacterium]
MQVSLNILLDSLKEFNPQCNIKEKHKSFSGVGISGKSTQGKYSDYIYVVGLEKINEQSRRDPSISIIVVKKKDSVIPTNFDYSNSIICDFDGDILDFFSYVQASFALVINWCAKMDEYLIRNRSIQDVLSLSESVIGNTITISDSSFALVAYTQGIDCDCHITSRLIQKGYHDQDAIDLFNKNKMAEKWKDAIDIYENTSCNISDYPIVCKVIHYYNNYYSHIVMICNNKPLTPGIKDLFKLLVDHLMVSFEKQWLDNNQMPHIHDSLIISLIGPNDLSEETVRNRARNSGLPFLSKFVYLVIETDDASNIMLQRIERELTNIAPDVKVTLYKQSLAVLITQPLRSTDKSPEILAQYESVLKRYNARSGVSNGFSCLTELHMANEQARVALGAAKLGEVKRFDDCYIRQLLTADPQTQKLSTNTISCNILKEILAYDEKHNTNNYELLKVYLDFDRRATETAEVMHMHRNNVIYRIGRICEQVNINLDDPKVRLRLLLAYEILGPKETKQN